MSSDLSHNSLEAEPISKGSFEDLLAELERHPTPWLRSQYYRLLRAWKYHVSQWPRVAREFVHRGRHGWAPSDTWSLDHYLAGVIGHSLNYFADVNRGWPGEDSEWPKPEDWDAELRKHAAVLIAYVDSWKMERDEETASHEATAASIARLSQFWGSLWD